MYMEDNPIVCKSKKQIIVPLSSREAEYRAISKVVGELVWLERLLTELIEPCNLPISVFCDSQAAIHITKNLVFHERTKHIKVISLETGYKKASFLFNIYPQLHN